MMSLFNSFDLFFFNFQYVLILFLSSYMLLAVFLNYDSSLYFIVLKKIFIPFLETLKPKMFNLFVMTYLLSLMIFLLYLNIFSIFPYIFSFTSQISIVISFSMMVWLSFFFLYMVKNMKGFLNHAIPEGTPIYLTWFLFLIEITSNLIRPVTLSVRLIANILAGHLLMILLSKIALKMILGGMFYLVLNFVELFVSFIQAYIFMTMSALYFSDLK